MNPQQETQQVGRFHVQVGHWRVRVPGRDHADAIEQARKCLCEEMPRLWDVISNLNPDRFQVEAVG